ncbi:hypothetical protein E4T39_03186 [Aureobasidium subglaciale]|nr:hypothetical protein E4T39_03186 [Aureobasidium subglaciale]
MGRISAESSRSSMSLGDAENGEGLPLYSDISVTTQGNLSAPGEKATPDEVREFLVSLLIKNRGLHQDHARRVAAKWTLGTGRELSSYPPLLYAEIFGLEDAWMVYKEAKLFIRTEKKKQSKVNSNVVGFCILSVFFGTALTVAIMANFDTHTAVKVVSVYISVFAGVAWLITTLIALFDKTTDESKIEAELTKGLVTKNKD